MSGGCGATTLALNLAYELGQTFGFRGQKSEVRGQASEGASSLTSDLRPLTSDLCPLTSGKDQPLFIGGQWVDSASGKTFAAAMYLLRTRWMVPGLQVFLIDPLGEFTRLARALGGNVVSLGPRGRGRLNPLDPSTTGHDASEKAARVATLLRCLFPTLRDEESARLDGALQRLFDDPPCAPTFADLADRIGHDAPPGDRLTGLLEVFRSGSLRHLAGLSRSDLGLPRCPFTWDVRIWQGIPAGPGRPPAKPYKNLTWQYSAEFADLAGGPGLP